MCVCGKTRNGASKFSITKFPHCKNCVNIDRFVNRVNKEKYVIRKVYYPKVDIGCKTCGYMFSCNLKHFSYTQNCQRCIGNIVLFEEIKVPKGYVILSSKDQYKNQHSILQVRCDRGHVYSGTQNKLLYYGCTYCSPSKPLNIEEKVKAIEATGYKYISGNLSNNKNIITIQCSNNHIKKAKLVSILYEKSGCSQCNSIKKASKAEKIIQSWLDEKNIQYEINKRDIIPPFEVDIYIPSKNLAIEINGEYYHRVEIVGKESHYNKYKALQSKGIILLTILDSEINDKTKEIISRYLNGSDIYNRTETILVDNRFPLNDLGYKMIEEISPLPISNTRYTIYDCGKSLFQKCYFNYTDENKTRTST